MEEKLSVDMLRQAIKETSEARVALANYHRFLLCCRTLPLPSHGRQELENSLSDLSRRVTNDLEKLEKELRLAMK